jgi:hypothetical protein
MSSCGRPCPRPLLDPIPLEVSKFAPPTLIGLVASKRCPRGGNREVFTHQLFCRHPTTEPLRAASGRAMRHHSFVRGLLTATTLVTGLLLLGSTAASAQTIEPPVLGKARITCHDEGGEVVAKLRNPNATVQHYMVAITGGDIHYDYVVSPAAHGAELIEFGGLPDGTYLLRVQNADGDFVANTRVPVQCDATPPTSTPTATPTETPTAPPSETPTSTSSATTAGPAAPVDVPTAVEAGLPGPAAQEYSSHEGTIVGAVLLAVGIVIGLTSLLVRRRRGLHHL